MPHGQWRGLWADEMVENPLPEPEPEPEPDRERGTRPRARPRGRGVLAVAAVGLFFTGVVAVVAVPQPQESSTPNLIAHSVDLAEEAGSARVSLSFAFVSPGELPPEYEGAFGGEGVASLVEPRARMTLLFPGPGGEAEEVEFREVGTRMYVRSPEFTETAGFETEWFSIDFAELTGLDEADLLGTDFSSGDVTQDLQYLRGASDVEEIGREDVRGVATTRYHARVDAADALDEVPAEGREFFEKSLEQTREQFGTTEFSVDVWVDDRGLPRRFVFEYDVSADPALPPGTSMTVSAELYDFGVEVDVEPPPEDDVLDLTDFLRQGYGLD